ncbi:MAG: AAA family ATPase [Lachnospiraceae bacterium]
MNNYVITIARGYGSGGSHIARKLSEELNIPVYDTEILRMASDLSGINESYFFEANEKINKGQLTLVGKSDHTWRILPPQDKRYLSNDNLFAFQAKVMLGLASAGKPSCIIIGKAANYVLRTFPNVLKLNIQAPMDKCLRNIEERLVVDEIEAKRSIEKINKYRMDYYRYYTGKEWLDPAEYDLSINTGLISEEETVGLIKYMLQTKYPQCFQ